MTTITDERLRIRTEKAIALQSQGFFIVDRRQDLPLSTNGCLSSLSYGHSRDELGRPYDFENEWGKFNSSPEDYSLLILRRGTPPPELLPQPRLALASATVHIGFVSIHNNGSSFDMDLETRDRLDYATLRMINQTLLDDQLPVVVWKAEEADRDTPPIIRIANDSAMLFASSAIWSPEDQQLVATQVVTTSQELLKAIKATLANSNGKSYITVKTPDDSAYLRGAKRGFIHASNSLVQANAEGTVTALLHPLSGDPQTTPYDHFFVVVAPGENLSSKFTERLDLAIPWPLQPEWAEYLLEAGQDDNLIQVLPSAGNDFTAALRVVKNESKWQQILSSGLETGRISIS